MALPLVFDGIVLLMDVSSVNQMMVGGDFLLLFKVILVEVKLYLKVDCHFLMRLCIMMIRQYLWI